ncbi:MAG: DUF1080 domain-containing protein [Phycisphaera sp.]|nr:DUF1080 domain-containing protein [Phycisphaera sp.]
MRSNPFITGCLLLGTLVVSITAFGQEVDTEVAPPWWSGVVMKPLVPNPPASGGAPEGWSVVGGPVRFEFTTGPDGDLEIRGSGTAPRNAFLASDRAYGDFLVEFEVMIDRNGGNSGFQIRSAVERDRMVGYQIEIDPSERSWSAGLYDEARRGWLATLQDMDTARDAFVPGKWNVIRILAVGPRIRTWINDVPAIDHLDFVDRTGRFGFQVHSGKCDVRWRRIRIADLGVRKTASIIDGESLGGFDFDANPEVRRDAAGIHFDATTGGGITTKMPIPDLPSVLEIEATMAKGLMLVQLGDMTNGPGYGLRIPGPIGKDGEPGRIRILRSPDRMQVLVDDVPLIPGPPDLDGPLSLRIGTVIGAAATISRADLDLPAAAEVAVIERARSRPIAKPDPDAVETQRDSK